MLTENNKLKLAVSITIVLQGGVWENTGRIPKLTTNL